MTHFFVVATHFGIGYAVFSGWCVHHFVLLHHHTVMSVHVYLCLSIYTLYILYVCMCIYTCMYIFVLYIYTCNYVYIYAKCTRTWSSVHEDVCEMPIAIIVCRFRGNGLGAHIVAAGQVSACIQTEGRLFFFEHESDTCVFILCRMYIHVCTFTYTYL